MDGGAGGYPDRREDEQPGIAPVDAGGAAVDQVAPVAEPTVQPIAPAEQPEQPGDTTDAVTGAPIDATTASGPTAGEPRKFGLFHAMGVPVKPDGRGSPVPRSAVDDHIQQAQEKARRDRADALRHQAVIAAIKRQIRSQDAQELHDAYEAARMFGIDLQALRGQSKVLDDDLNEQEYNATSVPRRLSNAAERQSLQSNQGKNFSRYRSLEQRRLVNEEFREMGIGAYEDRRRKAMGLTHEGPPFKDLDAEQGGIEQTQTRLLTLIIDAENKKNEFPDNPTARRMAAAQTDAEAFRIFWEDPVMLLGEGFAESASAMALGAGGAALGPVGAVFTGIVEFDHSLHAKIVENLKAEGVDLTDRDAIRAAINDKEKMQKVFSGAWRHTLATFVTDRVGGRVTSKAQIPVKQPVLSAVVNAPVKAAAEGLKAVASGQAGAIAADEEYKPGERVKDFLQAGAGSVGGSLKDGVTRGVPASINRYHGADQERQRLSSHRYVEPQIATAEKTADLTAKAIDLAKGARISKRYDKNWDEDIDNDLGAGRIGYVAPGKLRQMIEAGDFFGDSVRDLGLKEKIAKAEADGKDVELPMKDFVKGHIQKNRIEKVMQNLKFEEDGPTGGEARPVAQREAVRLKRIEDRFKGLVPTKVEGGHAFDEIKKELQRDMVPDERSRQAARRIEVLEQRARDMSTPQRRETADTVYLRDEYRKAQGFRLNFDSKESRRLEDEYVAKRLGELGIAKP